MQQTVKGAQTTQYLNNTQNTYCIQTLTIQLG